MAPVTRRKQAEMEANSSIIEESSPAPKSSTPRATTSKRGQKLALRGKEEGMSPSKSVAKKGTVTMFDDEEMNLPALVAEKAVAERAAPADVEESEEDEEDEIDDDAPEAVSTTKAASEIKAAAKATQKAAQEQATAQKRKRQERDALLKKQAEERKRLVAEARSSPAGPASDSDDQADSPDEDDDEKEQASDLATAAPRPLGSSRRVGQLAVPALLPAELLTDSSSSDEDDDDDAGGAPVRSKPKRRKVAAVERSLARLDRAPQDATIGSTVYQVARTADGRLPPKAKQLSKSTKEMLLKRNRAPTKQRRQGAGGFLAKR
ncbi:U3 snoRNA associated [Cordyceps fumosorosea ARSEF 2679]|uniref:U3 snoRNA associated n=1 Tax=Cordyceps fumosorosea (strain ARSEF 2679) TaxID=1081104 RepID=A0A167ZFN5_CORFA|nr:U3 snoRNA associated [Cordyceps fumosorosea ARSEF 2679]OAA67458.1 U3 snoRNA associated [Cordyceps fumosorosea ARSEF 2679]